MAPPPRSSASDVSAAVAQYRLSSAVRMRAFGDELIVLDVQRDLSYSFVGTGALLLHAVERGAAPAEIAREITASYEVDFATAERDVHDLLAALVDEGVLVVAEPQWSRGPSKL